jgi:hypothetical protein
MVLLMALLLNEVAVAGRAARSRARSLPGGSVYTE